MNYKNQNLIEMKNNISTIFYSTILSALAILVCAWINMLTYTHSNRFIVGTIVAPVNEEIIKFVASMFLATQTKLNRVASGFLLGFLLLWLLFFNSNKKRIDAKYYLEKNKLLILSIVISILIFLLYVLYRGEIYINCIKALHIQGYCL